MGAMPATTLVSLGWDPQRAAEVAAHPASGPGASPGRVVRVERDLVRVATEDGVVAVPTVGLAVGDWVLTDGLSWASALDRRTELRRKDSGQTSDEQLLAANVDVVVVVEPMDPRPNARRVERMTTLAWASGATPLVVLTKSDLARGGEVAEIAAVAPGVEVLEVGAETGDGLDVVRAHLAGGRTFVLLGPSGAGKSTLVNALAGEEVLATGAVRGDGRGKHTTTHRELVVVPGLGCLVDTPGIRGVGLVADEDGLEQAFPEVVALAAACRFTDCEHRTEPGCAVLHAVEEGRLPEARLASYRHLLREIAHQTARKTSQDRSALRSRGRQANRSMRESMTAKGRGPAV
jgi:ribosome biogenesis GTPase